MATVKQTFTSSWKEYGGAKSLLFSSFEFKEQWLQGIPLCNPYTGETISDDFISQRILAAQQRIENELGIKLNQQTILEQKDYVKEEFQQFGFLKASWPVLSICSLKGRLNERTVITYPAEWLSHRRDNADTPHNTIYIIPNGAASITFHQLMTYYPHYFSYFGTRQLPNYWQIHYVTGFKQVPEELIELVGLVASIYVLPQIELSIGGGNPTTFGLASQSLSLDGLSQSTSKINGGNIFSNRMKDFGTRLKEDVQRLKGIYSGIKFDVC